MSHALKKATRTINTFLLNLGFDAIKVLALRNYFKYREQRREFIRSGGVITNSYLVLTDYDEKAGAATGDYFHQDLLVASYIYKNNPVRHIDVGSRIDGFVAHVASFRGIEVMDVRDLENTGHENISFLKANLMDTQSATSNITDSLSCLHAIEHFGLGRYGEPIDPNGHLKGFGNMLRMLKPGGVFYISFPLAKKNEVHFNAHRKFNPLEIYKWIGSYNCAYIDRIDFIDNCGELHLNIDVQNLISAEAEGLGIYTIKTRIDNG